MKTLFLTIIWLLSAHIYSQNTIQGTVVDYNSNEPIPFANIYLPELEKGTITNENGEFTIQDLPTGNFKILVSIIGFKTLSKTINIPLVENLNISLEPSAIEMEQIIISTPFHKLQSENVMKVEQAKITDLKSNGAFTLADGLTSIAGVESITTGQGIGKPVIRGLSSNRVLVYAQGVRLENQQFGDEHGLGLSDSGIESVEVIKGPASLLYGSDALGGVLYLNPERFANSNSASADANINYFTNTEGTNTNVGVKSSTQNFKFLFRGSYAEHSDYKTKDYSVTNTRFKEYDFKSGIGYQNSNFKSEFRYNVNHSVLGIPEEIAEQSSNVTPLLPFQQITNHIFSSKSTVFLENSSLDVNLGYIYNDRNEFEEEHHHDEEEEDEEEEHEEEHLEPALHMKLKTFNYDVKYNLSKLGKFETIVGAQGMHQTNSNYGEEILIPDASTNDFGIFATSHIHFNEIDIQLGARYDYRTINIAHNINPKYNSFNGAIGFKTQLFKSITTRLNLASGFRAPNLAELTSNGSHEGANRFEIGNINLSNEQNIQVDLALEYKNDHIEVFVNGFYNKIKDYIFLSPNGEFMEDDPVFLYLQDDASFYGGEFGLHFHPHPLDWLHFQSSYETVIGKQSNDNFLPLIPANKIKNTIRVEFDNKKNTENQSALFLNNSFAYITLNSTFAQNNISDFETQTDGYNLLNLGFGGEFKISNHLLKIIISGTNLTNKKYVNHLSRLKTDGILNIGRNINLSLNYSL